MLTHRTRVLRWKVHLVPGGHTIAELTLNLFGFFSKFILLCPRKFRRLPVYKRLVYPVNLLLNLRLVKLFSSSTFTLLLCFFQRIL